MNKNGVTVVKDLPAISDHTHAPVRRTAIELRRLPQILLAPNTLRVAEPSFGQSIRIAPVPRDLKAAQRQRLILLRAPAVEVADAEFVDGQRELCAVRFLLAEVLAADGAAAGIGVGVFVVVGDLELRGVHGAAEPGDSFLWVGAHAPAVTAGERVEEHAGRVVLFGGDAEVVGGFFEVAVFVELDAFGDVFFGGQGLGLGDCVCGGGTDGAV